MANIEPYLFFGGSCEEALNFYRDNIGISIEYMGRYSEAPEPMPAGMLPEGFENKIMHATFKLGSTTLMASDGNEIGPHFNGFSLSLNVANKAEAEKAFNALAQGGKVVMPLSKTFWAPSFGMLTDKFGLGWMVNAAAE